MTARPIPRVERPFAVDVTLPGSKSITLRHILMSTLADVPTRLDGVPRCDDVDSMFAALACLGVDVQRTGKQARVEAPTHVSRGPIELDLGMSGVSLRLLLAHAALRPSTTRFTGHRQLYDRPNTDLLDALRLMGCEIDDDGGRLPIVVRGPEVPARETTLSMGVSSQYLSGLLLMAPALPQGLTIHLHGATTSASYIGVTQAEMARRGVEVRRVDASTVTVPPAVYRGGDVMIEGDASAATYHAALATLHGGRVQLLNLGDSTRQGDYDFLALCERIGATVDRSDSQVTLEGPPRLRALGEVDMIDMPDAAPTLMAVAPFLPEPTHITGLATLRVKEVDRIAFGVAELRKAGVRVEEYDAAVTVHPSADLRAVDFETYEDHRMAMGLSVLASKIGGCRVLGSDCVSKTYADYWQDFDEIYKYPAMI
ncbi:MAG: 3-phosphoshikimate 1-carboxyvinyltransferase [Gammaproteobacteria bacterium]|nr:3-phosphoshikimate 1-carboxyvinyltransferase [Gammaproteobacteria bacterium]